MQTFKCNHLFVLVTPRSPLRLYPVCLTGSVSVCLTLSVCPHTRERPPTPRFRAVIYPDLGVVWGS